MKTFDIFDQNVLCLLPSSENAYQNYHYDFLKKKINNIHRFNFVDYAGHYGIGATKRAIIQTINQKKIDVIISFPFATDNQLSIEYYLELKKNARIVFWLFDDENYFNVYSKYYCQISDAAITTDYFSFLEYERYSIPAILYFSSYSKELYHPENITRDIDVSFVGNCCKNDRMEYIEYLLKNAIKVKYYGQGSSSGFVKMTEVPHIFARTKINLNFTKLDKISSINSSEPLLNRARQNKGRPIEIALTKSFCLSEYAPSLTRVFQIKTEIDVFNTKEELLEKIQFYLQNDKIRTDIAENAYKIALERYESEVYISSVLAKLENILANRRSNTNEKIYINDIFKANEISSLVFTSIHLLKNFKLFEAIMVFPLLFKYGPSVFLSGSFMSVARMANIIVNKLRRLF